MKGKTPRNLVTCLVFHFHKVSPNTKKTFLWSLIKVIRYYHRSQGIIFLIPPSKRWLLLLKRIHFVPEVVKLGPLDFLFVNHLYLLYVRWIPIISIIWRQKTLYFCQKYWLHYKLLREVTVLKLTFIQVNTISQEASKSCFFFYFFKEHNKLFNQNMKLSGFDAADFPELVLFCGSVVELVLLWLLVSVSVCFAAILCFLFSFMSFWFVLSFPFCLFVTLIGLCSGFLSSIRFGLVSVVTAFRI